MISFFRYVFFICILSFLSGCAQKKTVDQEALVSENKINGVSFVASRDTIQQKNIDPVLEIHANYAAIMPFGFIKSLDHPEIIYNQERQWFGETMQGAQQYIKMLHKNKIHVMLKPQIWVWRGEFTGLLKMASEEDWLQLEDSYRNFIMDFAEVAEEEHVELFCIGTELEKFIEMRPQYWRNLISDIRKIYKGKLTYAANWDEYKRVPFWGALDYIGVDAYFPIASQKTPTVEEAKQGWEVWKNEMKALSEKESKKILFTEYGYRSVDFAGKEPWLSNREMATINLKAQSNTLQALYAEIWNEDWFAGGFLWKWFLEHDRAGGGEDTQFSPQNKPAEKIVRNYYKTETK